MLQGDLAIPLCLLSLLMPALGREAIGIKNRLAALALADAPACCKRLSEGQPVLRCKTAINDRSPQYKHIDARISPPRNRVAGKSRHDCCRTPRLRPRANTGFQLRDNLGGHLFIKQNTRAIAAFLLLPRPVRFRLPTAITASSNPKPGEAGWAASSDQRGADCAGHIRRAVAMRKTP